MSVPMARDGLLGLGPLGRRLLVAFALVAVSSILVLTTAALIGVDRGVDADQRTVRHELADSVAATAASAYTSAGGWEGADLTAIMRLGEASRAHITVMNADGSTLASTGTGMGMGMGMGGESRGAGMSLESTTVPVVVDGTAVGSVRVALPGMATTRVLDIAWSWILLAAIAALLIAFAVSWVVTRRLVRPIRTMTDAARMFTAGDRKSRATVRGPGEIGDLAVAFNAMADEVVVSAQARRSMTVDIAHELRTPLAALQAGLEELRDGLVEPTPDTLAGLHDQSLRLGRIVVDLEELTAIEASDQSLQVGVVDLARLTRAELSVREPQLRAAGLHSVLHLGEGALVLADSDRLHQAVGNLLANAARYCRPGDTVTITVAADGDSVVLEVADTGPGIPEAELPHLFERLWRGSAARDIPGSGVGLALVREIVTRHGGTVEASSTVGVGSTFTVRLPAARAAASPVEAQ